MQEVFGFVKENLSGAQRRMSAASEERGVGKGRHVLSPHQHTLVRSANSAPNESSLQSLVPGQREASFYTGGILKGYQMNRALLCLVLCCWQAHAADAVLARLDLSKFGYRTTGSTSVLADYSELSFLSNDLLVVSINQRSFGPVEPTFADTPESTIIVFDIGKASVTTVEKMAVEKLWDSVQAISAERFAVLNEKGLQFCDQKLHCEPIGPTTGPMFVSPQGKRVAVGGNRLTAQVVIDTESRQRIADFERSQKTFQRVVAIPGDEAVLLDRDNRILIQRPGVEGVPLNIDDKGTFPEFRFLNGQLIACLDHDASEVVVAGMDGKPKRRYMVAKAWRTGFLPTTSGTRFAIYEHGYTALNSIVNVLDIDDGRPQNFQRVRIIDLASGNEVYRLEWDPRPGLIRPALSPNGGRIARVRAGILEVFQVN